MEQGPPNGAERLGRALAAPLARPLSVAGADEAAEITEVGEWKRARLDCDELFVSSAGYETELGADRVKVTSSRRRAVQMR
ncbi:unnamed protein product [Heligmosomoides polygyrus]|uniref:DUF4140 domain-containing protein n=1 Tax=Heligmosomoides polygyrus TaxID=6339 RepID=A0A183G5E3_HELPZ|nr:unnamed protein product [Heligmosomoides polygyrus]